LHGFLTSRQAEKRLRETISSSGSKIRTGYFLFYLDPYQANRIIVATSTASIPSQSPSSKEPLTESSVVIHHRPIYRHPFGFSFSRTAQPGSLDEYVSSDSPPAAHVPSLFDIAAWYIASRSDLQNEVPNRCT